MTRVFLAPSTKGKKIVGGIARVVEAQERWLPEYGIDLVQEPASADVLAVHASMWIPPRKDQFVVTHCHGLYWADDHWDSKWFDQTNKEIIDIMQRADVVTAPSQWVANSIARGSWLSPVVIGHGIEIDEWHQGTSENYVLWDKARQDAACDPRPVNVLASAMSDVKFVSTFGDEAKNTRITGVLPYEEHKGVMQHAGVYLATARETFGVSLLEALASGVPIVGWNWGGQAEIVDDSVGRLVTPGDYDGLSRAIRYCLEHRQSMSSACRLLVTEKYQWKDVVKQYADLYEQTNQPHRGPTVSVIIPSYNLSKYLPAAIESVLKQDYQDTEIIVVDDCSTDDSYDVASQYLPLRHEGGHYDRETGKARLLYESGNTNFNLLKTPVNSNMPTVLNTGIRAARGKYILNLDADNMLPPGALGILARLLDDNRDLDIVYGKIKFVQDDGVTPDTTVTGTGDGISKWPPAVPDYYSQMNHKNQIPSSAMFRRKLWEQVGGYRGRCRRIGEDPDFWCRTMSVGANASRATDAVTLLYRMRDSSRSHVEPEWPWEAWYPNRLIQRDGPIHIIDKPLVSVIIPVGPGHIPEDALDSLYAQTMHEWECILVNDTGKELAWQPSWVRVVSTGVSGAGVSTARNVGIKASRGQAFVLLDADDFLADHKALEKMWKALRQDSYVFSEWQSEGVDYHVERWQPQDQLQKLCHPITCMFPITVRDKVRFDESMRVGEDWDYILAVLSNNYCPIKIAEPLIYYRQTSGKNRNGLLQNIDTVRQEMNTRWRDKIMACGCQGSGIQVQTNPSMEMLQQNSGELVLLEFVKPMTTTMTWTGPVTGHNYRFGSESGHRIGYVHRSDAQHFLQRPEFELADVGS